MRNLLWAKRYRDVSQVPLVVFAAVPHNHPDLACIEQAYLNAGVGLGIDHASYFRRPTMKTSELEYAGHELARINRLLEGVEYLPVKMAVVDYLGMRDASGIVQKNTDFDRRFGTRDLRHVALYDLVVVRLNRVARVAQAEPTE